MEENPFETPEPASFPPLFHGEQVEGAADPFTKACTKAALGCTSGLLVHNVTPDRLRAAIVFAPETPLTDAMSVLCACGVGFQNALGALAPPEVAVHLGWNGDIIVNGATCGRLRVAASPITPEDIPDWLVIGLEVHLIPQSDEGGYAPDQTSLFQEGCGDVSPIRLLESWSRHTLVWVNQMDSEGIKALHGEWRGLAHGVGDNIEFTHEEQPINGTFVGIDEGFGMLIRDGETTHLVPLTSLLERI